MNILMVNRADALTNYGGDTTQMLETKVELEKLGQRVEIALGPQKLDKYLNYDLIHIFNIQTAEFTFNEVLKVKKIKKPIILSPIWWDFYEDYMGVVGDIANTKSIIDSLKEKMIIYALKYNQKLNLYPKQRKILDLVDLILPNSYSEFKNLESSFKNIDKDKVYIVYNGVSDEFLVEKDYSLPEDLKNEGIVKKGYALQVGRIDSGKNVFSTIKACNELNIPLIIIGKEGKSKYFRKYFNKYYRRCITESGQQTLFLGYKDKDKIIPYYKNARIHILPSIRETPGLTSLEAGVLGCTIVTTKIGSTMEYFEDLAFYCDPMDFEDIKNAIMLAWNSEGNEKLRKKIINEYTWNNAAKETLSCYSRLVSDNY